MLCQTWSKYCGLRKVVFPSGDVWIQPLKGPEPLGESSGWILVGGNSVTPPPSSNGANKPRRSWSEFVITDDDAAGVHNTLEGELPLRTSVPQDCHVLFPRGFGFSCSLSFTHRPTLDHGSHASLFTPERSNPPIRSTPAAVLSVTNPIICPLAVR